MIGAVYLKYGIGKINGVKQWYGIWLNPEIKTKNYHAVYGDNLHPYIFWTSHKKAVNSLIRLKII